MVRETASYGARVLAAPFRIAPRRPSGVGDLSPGCLRPGNRRRQHRTGRERRAWPPSAASVARRLRCRARRMPGVPSSSTAAPQVRPFRRSAGAARNERLAGPGWRLNGRLWDGGFFGWRRLSLSDWHSGSSCHRGRRRCWGETSQLARGAGGRCLRRRGRRLGNDDGGLLSRGRGLRVCWGGC